MTLPGTLLHWKVRIRSRETQLRRRDQVKRSYDVNLVSIGEYVRKDQTWQLLTMSAIILVGMLGALVSTMPAVPLLVVAAVAALLAFTGRPKLSVMVWLVALGFVPYWVGINAVGYLPVVSAIGVGILAGNVANGYWRVSKTDLPIVLLIIAGSVAVAAGNSNQGVWLSMITQWLVAYLVGKIVVPAAGVEFCIKAFAAVFGIIGLFALAELVFSWHPYVALATSNPAYATWSPIQIRGGVERSEWAMGHSIALGGALSAAVAFIVRSSHNGFAKTVLLLACFVGIACTFSRAAISSAVLTLALSLLFMRDIKAAFRFILIILAALAGFIGLRILAPIFELASRETAGSSSYRERMLEELLPQLSFAGRSSAAVYGGDGSVRYGSFQSIDSTFLSIGLGFGWIAALVMLLPFVFMVVRLSRGVANTAEIALIGQLPMLFTVALITQYQLVVWFIAGFAAAEVSKALGPDKVFQENSMR